MIKVPVGKTVVKVLNDVYQSRLKKGDIGYIDGYLRGGDDRPYVQVVRLSDGGIDFAMNNELQAINFKDEQEGVYGE